MLKEDAAETLQGEEVFLLDSSVLSPQVSVAYTASQIQLGEGSSFSALEVVAAPHICYSYMPLEFCLFLTDQSLVTVNNSF